ncbi:hypothetical protein DFH09DRAFT_1179029 [Mycena vulgaris]|nr:hypothetical protein DFH09DRAFT_1179029 [Mycena vulgaris]
MTLQQVEPSSRARRRSLKALLQTPLFPRSTSFSRPPISTGGAGSPVSLPEDVLHTVVDQLSPIDILNLSLTSSHVRTLLVPALYRTVSLRSSRTCGSGLRMLANRPEFCAHVRKLTVRPNYYLAWPAPDSAVSERCVAQAIERLAPTLTWLRSFDWDGCEMPPDFLWHALRTSCPDLTELFTNVGYQPLYPESELFKFSALTNFSLSVRHGLGEVELFPPHEELPPCLWTMLIERCPNLTELTICSFSASQRLFDLTPLTSGRWPLLSSLTLGAFGYNTDFTLAGPPVGFDVFLAAHSGLSYLRLAWNFKRWMSPDDLPPLVLPPALEEFSGVAQQLVSVSVKSITTLDLMCEPLYGGCAGALGDALRSMPLLTSLELWMHVPDPRADNWVLWEALWRATPGLEDLHFMCTTPFGKQPLADLAYSLRRLPHLRTFALTKGHRYADESMRASAVRLFRELGSGPSSKQAARGYWVERTPLAQVSIRWARAACRNHLKQEGTYERVASDLLSVNGSEDENGRRRKRNDVIEAWERGLRAVGGAFERRYQFVLR